MESPYERAARSALAHAYGVRAAENVSRYERLARMAAQPPQREDVTPERAQAALKEYGSISRAAAELGVPRTTFRELLEKAGVPKWPDVKLRQAHAGEKVQLRTQYGLSPEQAVEALQRHGTAAAAALALRMPRSTFRALLADAGVSASTFAGAVATHEVATPALSGAIARKQHGVSHEDAVAALRVHNDNVSKAAKALGIPRSTFRDILADVNRRTRAASRGFATVEALAFVAGTGVGFVAAPRLNAVIRPRPFGRHVPPSAIASVGALVAGALARRAGMRGTAAAAIGAGVGLGLGTVASARAPGGLLSRGEASP